MLELDDGTLIGEAPAICRYLEALPFRFEDFSTVQPLAGLAPGADAAVLVRVEAVSGGQPLRVAGTTMGNDNRLWLVSALGFELDMELAPLLVVLRYDDVPGVIGKVGTLFGGSAVNIAARICGQAGAGAFQSRFDVLEQVASELTDRAADPPVLCGGSAARLFSHADALGEQFPGLTR